MRAEVPNPGGHVTSKYDASRNILFDSIPHSDNNDITQCEDHVTYTYDATNNVLFGGICHSDDNDIIQCEDHVTSKYDASNNVMFGSTFHSDDIDIIQGEDHVSSDCENSDNFLPEIIPHRDSSDNIQLDKRVNEQSQRVFNEVSMTGNICDNLDNSVSLNSHEHPIYDASTEMNFENNFDSSDKTNQPHDDIENERQAERSSETPNNKPHKNYPKSKTFITRNPPKLEKEAWQKINSEFRDINQKSWKSLKNSKTTPEQYVTDLNGMLASYLESKAEFQEKTKPFFKHNPTSNKSLEDARKQKISLNKKARTKDATIEDKENAKESIRTHSYLVKLNKSKEELSKAKQEEKAYKKNFWSCAKDVSNGTFGKKKSAPTFSETTANKYYKDQYERNVEINLEELAWFPNVEPPSTPYNLSAYTPKDIRAALLKKDKDSAPGFDDIVYEFLVKMPYLHHVLATTFTRIRDEGVAPDAWGASKIILLKKDENQTVDNPTHFRMISLTLNIGKLYHTLEGHRAMQFMLQNNYLDPTAQKAYVEGVNGCVEHITVIQEVIQHAKHNNKSANITWFDLQDAFGSVPHELIPYVLTYYHIPEQIITYVTSLYTKLTGTVFTAEWTSETFKFLKGVFAGDPLSGIIFLIIFNPIVEHIKRHNRSHGYEITTRNSNATFVTTTPFADDFNIITRENHQDLVTDVEEKIKSMGLVIKPSKCRSLTIQKGKVENVHFNLKDIDNEGQVNIATVEEKPMKFLGSEVTSENTPAAMFASLFSKLKSKLENINKSTLRGEYKVNIYSRYSLPSMRFYLSVHQMHWTHMTELDNLAKKYLKNWLGIQTNGVSDISIFHPYMLAIKTPSQMYLEAHAGNHAMMRMKGDTLVNHVLNSRLERESQWTRKFSTISHMQQMWQNNINEGRIVETHENETPTRINMERAKKTMKSNVAAETMETWNNKVQKLTVQGNFVGLLIEEKENVTWKSISSNIPKGVLSFALKACTNGLNTPDNLKRWGIRKFNKCDLCGNFSNLEHILNYCTVALKQKRYTWRHDSILNYLTLEMKKTKPDNITIYTDIPGHMFNSGTIPPDILTTSSRPDIVILDRKAKKIELLELTCSFEKNGEKANILKGRKYFDLKRDLETAGWTTQLIPFVVGSRGLVTKHNKQSIYNSSKRNHIKLKHTQIIKDISKIALLCSFSIFQAHCQPTWQDPPLLHP